MFLKIYIVVNMFLKDSYFENISSKNYQFNFENYPSPTPQPWPLDTGFCKFHPACKYIIRQETAMLNLFEFYPGDLTI